MKYIILFACLLCGNVLAQQTTLMEGIFSDVPGTYGAAVWSDGKRVDDGNVLAPSLSIKLLDTSKWSTMLMGTSNNAIVTVTAAGKVTIRGSVEQLKAIGKNNYQAKAFADMAIEVLRLRIALQAAQRQIDAQLGPP